MSISDSDPDAIAVELLELLMEQGDPAVTGTVMTLVMARLLTLLPPAKRDEAMRVHTEMALKMAALLAPGNEDTKQ